MGEARRTTGHGGGRDWKVGGSGRSKGGTGGPVGSPGEQLDRTVKGTDTDRGRDTVVDRGLRDDYVRSTQGRTSCPTPRIILRHLQSTNLSTHLPISFLPCPCFFYSCPLGLSRPPSSGSAGTVFVLVPATFFSGSRGSSLSGADGLLPLRVTLDGPINPESGVGGGGLLGMRFTMGGSYWRPHISF